MKTPVATYRVQLNREFNFDSLKCILPYLVQLGISHVYASPILKARTGSTHGYDVTDPDLISDELGGRGAFEDLIKEAAACGLEWIQDIVPNHMSYSPENKMISDVMKHGASSSYRGFFDVDWNHPSRDLRGRILAPFLADKYRKCLRRGEIRLVFNDGFAIRYHELEFPVSLGSYREILCGTPLRCTPSVKNEKNLGQKLEALHDSDKKERELIEEATQKYNRNPELLDELLRSQVFALAHWRTALRQINYRRFFDIIEMIGLLTEEPDVFEATHRLILRFIAEGKISGLRIDHVDGLHNPAEYLEELRSKAPEAYIVVEKILTKGESLPNSWPVQGTTGYDFVNHVNALFIDKKAETKFDIIYSEFTGNREKYNNLVSRSKKLVVQRSFVGDVENLSRLLRQVLVKRNPRRKLAPRRLREVVTQLLCSFPVYRSYLTGKYSDKEALGYFKSALSEARRRNKDVENQLITLEEMLDKGEISNDILEFVMRLQQFTGAIMAKGLEDTALYVYNRFLSLNEVGGDPSQFGCLTKDFHMFNRARLVRWPLSMNTTATHDTKRGEDVRARLNVLSEIPSEFTLKLERWCQFNLKKKKKVNGKLVPDRNEEYGFYQTLIGAFPSETSELHDFTGRLKANIVKVIREAKTNSSWLDPDSGYEQAAATFVTEVLSPNDDNDFLLDFLPFQKKIAFFGCINSLAQTLLKITCPGIPDFYQGAELWDLNLVDPDNRRQVDFQKRTKLLKDVLDLEPQRVQGLLKKFEDGKAKLYEIHKALEIRRKKRDLFEQGEYIPLAVKGIHSNHVVSFCRRKGADFAIIVIPRFLTVLTRMPNIPTSEAWKNTHICLPTNAPKRWREVFTERRLSSATPEFNDRLRIGDLLETFPVALLLSGESGR